MSETYFAKNKPEHSLLHSSGDLQDDPTGQGDPHFVFEDVTQRDNPVVGLRWWGPLWDLRKVTEKL